MELNYNELKRRDVINVADGKCLGRITDMRLSFPKGVLVGITVPGKRKGLFSFFDKSELYIDRSRIIKIGGDVILVNLKCGDSYAQFTEVEEQKIKTQAPIKPPCPPPCPPCPPPCPPCPPPCPPCPPPCEPYCPPVCSPCPPPRPNNNSGIDLSSICDENGRLDLSDY